MDPCMLNINTQLFVCVHEQTSGRRFLCFRAVAYYRVGRWFFMAADILHRSFRTRFICVYGARQILEDLFYCFVHLVSKLQIRQGFFLCCCRFLLRFSCKKKYKSWQKSKPGLKKNGGTKFKMLGSKVAFYCVKWETIERLWGKQTSARRFIVFHHAWLIYLATRFPA